MDHHELSQAFIRLDNDAVETIFDHLSGHNGFGSMSYKLSKAHVQGDELYVSDILDYMNHHHPEMYKDFCGELVIGRIVG
jgi:hypothetical protein